MVLSKTDQKKIAREQISNSKKELKKLESRIKILKKNIRETQSFMKKIK